MKAALPPIVPGVILACAVASLSLALGQLEFAGFGRLWLEPLVLAILGGAVLRTAWTPPPFFDPGIRFSAKTMLELAVVLMGASLNPSLIVAAGMPILLGVVVTVIMAIAAGFWIGRLLGLPSRMAMLVACGNAICGNSAIAAVAPAIDADSGDVATAVAFTAVLGIGVVMAVPFIGMVLGLGPTAGGVLAGLTVYAVPQVFAAASPMGPVAVQLGTMVKLVRVLMLAPVVACLSLIMKRRMQLRLGVAAKRGPVPNLTELLPLFILAFLALAALRSAGAVPDIMLPPIHEASAVLTVCAMAGLGLGVDLRSVAAAGPRVSIAATLSLVVLASIALGVIRFTGLE